MAGAGYSSIGARLRLFAAVIGLVTSRFEVGLGHAFPGDKRRKNPYEPVQSV